MFRLNFSHGRRQDHSARFATIRKVERLVQRPIGIMVDLQGPKLRIGTFLEGSIELRIGDQFCLDLDDLPGDRTRVQLPHTEIFEALKPGVELLLDDGKIRLEVEECEPGRAITRVKTAGQLSNRKGVNLPGATLPLSPLTDKDHEDLAFGLEKGADWIALSFVQRPEDVIEARRLVGTRARIMAKLEKPTAIENLSEIIGLSDGIMVARGDLGVELAPDRVPVLQRQIVRACRREGRPVVIATQMLESMTASSVPTRVEASDVATAVYEGADAVMLSAESASGRFPIKSVAMMDAIIRGAEGDATASAPTEAQGAGREKHADAICTALNIAAKVVAAKAAVTYTHSGSSSIRAARERPSAPILSLTSLLSTARQLTPVWGIHSVVVDEISDEESMTRVACEIAQASGFGVAGDSIVIMAGVPFGVSGSTNLLRTAALPSR